MIKRLTTLGSLSLVLAISFGLAAVPAVPAPVSDSQVEITKLIPPPKVSASAWLVYDGTAREPVAGVNASKQIPIASLTKLMTTLVVLERTKADELVEIPQVVNELPADAARMDARVGERWSVRDLIRATLISSANDAALALALHVGENETNFVQMMNDRAEELKLTDTSFASATGLDLGDSDLSVSSAHDLVLLAETVIRDPLARSAMSEPRLELKRPANKDGKKSTLEPIILEARNPLLGTYDGVDGVKTGFTENAGYMLISHHVDKESDAELFVVTANSNSEDKRATDNAALLDWARPLRTDIQLYEGGEAVAEIPVVRSHRSVNLFVCDTLEINARPGQVVNQEIVVPQIVKPPLNEGDELGKLQVRVGTADKITVPLCSADTLAPEDWSSRIRFVLGEYDLVWRSGLNEVSNLWQKLKEVVA